MPQKKYNRDMIRQWKSHIYGKADDIDPDKEHSWESLSYGYFLALTHDPKRARSLADEVYMQGLTK